jgi:hypothetical protein
MGKWVYRSTFSWPRHYLEMSHLLYAPAALLPGKEPPVLYRYSNSDPSVVQPASSRYTGYASGSPPLWDRGPVNSFLIRRGPCTGPRPGGWETLSYAIPAPIFPMSVALKITNIPTAHLCQRIITYNLSRVLRCCPCRYCCRQPHSVLSPKMLWNR